MTGAFLLRRVVGLVAVLLAMSVALFMIVRMIPGDPARAAAGQDASGPMIAAARERLGLDRPLWAQYGLYVANAVRGDLGTSIMSRRPVLEELLETVPATLELAGVSLLLSGLVGIALGLASAASPNRWVRSLGQILPAGTASIPGFWLGLILLLIVYGQLGLLPSGGRFTASMPPVPLVTGFALVDTLLAGRAEAFVDALKHLLLPAFVLGHSTFPVVARITRSAMVEVLAQTYIQTARSKGLSHRVVLYRHAFRNAAIPLATVLGLRLGDLLAGAVLIETIFSWPGAGRYAVQAIENLDYPALMGFVLFVAFGYSLINLAVDMLYFKLDPRISVR